MNRRRSGILVVACALALVACGAGAVPEDGGHFSSSPSTCRVTPDCSGYSYSNPSPGTVVVTAPKASGGNNREFFWSRSDRIEPDPTVCATFMTGQGIDQQGVVLRLNETADGDVTGISVTRNVWLGVFNTFNSHVWNTGADPTDPFRQFGSTVLRALPVRPAVYPLHLCARVAPATNDVQFLVWRNGQAKPPWGSTAQGGEATIPPGAPATGRGGWFAGHLTPGTSMTYSNLSVDGSVPTDLP
jgi:hypothetical protein